MTTKFLLLVLLITFGNYQFSHAQQTTQKGALDGKQYKIDFMKDGKTENMDTIWFRNGTSVSNACTKYGFKGSPYQAKKSGDTWTWEAVCKSDKEGTMDWKGTVKGNTIEGTCLWTKAGQADIHYTFKGTEQKTSK